MANEKMHDILEIQKYKMIKSIHSANGRCELALCLLFLATSTICYNIDSEMIKYMTSITSASIGCNFAFKSGKSFQKVSECEERIKKIIGNKYEK